MVNSESKEKGTGNVNTKISIGVVIPLVIGVFLIFSGSLAANTFQDEKQMQALEEEAATLSGILKVQSTPSPAFKDKLIKAQARLEKANNFFPAELMGSASLRVIIAVASHSDAQVINIQEKPPTRQIVGENVYYTWPFSLKVEGALWSLLTLIGRLERQEAGPLALQKVSLNKNKIAYSADIDLVFYTRSRTEVVPKPQKAEKGKG